MGNRILVVAAHPDDEVLGMGGTIARHIAEGDSVNIFFLGDGVSSRAGIDKEAILKRRKHATKACEMLGVTNLQFERYPDNRFDTVSCLDILQSIEKVKEMVDPHVVYTHHGGDLNVDHRITCQSVITAFRPQPDEIFTEIRCFEINSSTEWGGIAGFIHFKPDTYVDITPYVDSLVSAYECYADEIRPEPHIRSVESLKISALRRGREVGVLAAEAFITVRRIVRIPQGIKVNDSE